jgi:hypothetical protein
MTRTHVPPQCAGNRHLVGRLSLLTSGDVVTRGTPRSGGLHMYGLCAACNGLQSEHDSAYGALAGAVRGCAPGSDLLTGRRVTMPGARIRPGAVARSTLIGMFALNPGLRAIVRAAAEALLSRSSRVPLEGQRLMLALAAGRTARVAGAMLGRHVMGEPARRGTIGWHSHAQVYFPPLAWQLTDTKPGLLDREGWRDVTAWLLLPPDRAVRLNTAVPDLPAVVHPLHGRHWEGWLEMHADSVCALLESDDVYPDGRR